ncbi:MAG: hypothetical protein V3R81_06605 [Gammaproteobacteria bacterium]
MPIDTSHLSDTQKALRAPIVTHGNFYYFTDGDGGVDFIRAMLTAIVEAAPDGYRFLKVTFNGSTSHGRGVASQDVIFEPMIMVLSRMEAGIRVAVGYELQVSREAGVPEVDDGQK